MPTPQPDVDATLRYNERTYAAYYANPALQLRYDCLYRAGRVANLLRDHGVDVRRAGFSAFEYGFGAGHLLRVVSGASRVVGMEASPSAVARAQAAGPGGQTDWQMRQWADATRIPEPDASFDLVTASHVLEHLPDDDAALREWKRLLTPGGHLLILLPSNEVLFPGSKHLRTYEVDAFAARLGSLGLQRVAVDEHQRFDRPWKHRALVLASRKNVLLKLAVDGPKTLLFLPPQLLSWRLLAAVDAALGALGARSSSVAYLFRKPG